MSTWVRCRRAGSIMALMLPALRMRGELGWPVLLCLSRRLARTPQSPHAVLRRWMRASLRARSHRFSRILLCRHLFPRSLSFERPLSPSFSVHTSIFPHVGSCADTDVITHNVSAFLRTVNDGRYAAEFVFQGRETARRAAVKPRSDSFPPRCGSSVEK